jgi:hypothetical protein
MSGLVWGVKQEQIELGAKLTAQQEINVAFKHTSNVFEMIEEFELDEFLSSQIN